MSTICFPNLESFVNPKSIAIIGASKDETKMSGLVLKNLLKSHYKGDVFPINPKYETIAGSKCYTNILSVPSSIDVALIMVPSALVPDTLRDCVKCGAKFGVVFGAGYAEIGGRGEILQNEIKTIINKSDLKLMGPNCAGFWNLINRFGYSFSPVFDPDKFVIGNIGIVTQGGGLGRTILESQKKRIGFSYWFSAGNEVNLEVSDYIRYLIDDKDTRVIMTLIEGIRDGDKLKAVADLSIERKKPIVVLKIGRSKVGEKAAALHTAALTGVDAVNDAFFKQKGIIRVDDIDELVDTAVLLSRYEPVSGKGGIGIYTVSGGGGALVGDKAGEFGLEVPMLSDDTVQKLRAILPSFGTLNNPLDTSTAYDDKKLVENSLGLLVGDQAFDIILAPIIWGMGIVGEQIASELIKVSKRTKKPLISIWMGAEPEGEAGYRLLIENEMSVCNSVEKCLKAIKNFINYSQVLENSRSAHRLSQIQICGDNAIYTSMNRDKKVIAGWESKKILSRIGIPVSKEWNASSLDEAILHAEYIGYPLTLEMNPINTSHKVEAKTIRLEIENRENLARGYSQIIAEAKRFSWEGGGCGVLVRERRPDGVEVVVRMVQDLVFGPVIMVGLGGILAEAIQGSSLRIAPLSDADAEEMIKEVKGSRILEGNGGRPKSDIGAIQDALIRVSQLSLELKDILCEINIDPFIVFEEGRGGQARDCLITLK